MALKRSYINTELAVHCTVTLPTPNFHHLFRVMRCRNNEEIIAFNGDGYNYHGRLEQTEKKQGVIHIQQRQKNTNESQLHTVLLQGLSKGDRMDTAIQKAVELGVNEIYPVSTDFSAVKLDATRLDKKQQHWQSIIISACEQSKRSVIPTLHSVQTLNNILPQLDCDYRLMLHPYNQSNDQLKRPQHISRLAILIGPEGGLSEQDIQSAQQADFHPLQLGQRILRTETATISALSIAQHLWGDWHV